MCSVVEMRSLWPMSHKGVGSVAERRQGAWALDRVRFVSSTCDDYTYPSQLPGLHWLWKARVIARLWWYLPVFLALGKADAVRIVASLVYIASCWPVRATE